MDYCQTPLIFSKMAKVDTANGHNLGLPSYWLVTGLSFPCMSPSTGWTEWLLFAVYPYMSGFATLFADNGPYPDAFSAGMTSALKSSLVWFFTLLGQKLGPNWSYFIWNSSEPWTGPHRTGSMWFSLSSETSSDRFYIQILYKLLFTTNKGLDDASCII